MFETINSKTNSIKPENEQLVLTLNGRKLDSFGVWELWKNSSDVFVSLLQGWGGAVVIIGRWW
jgi:hypothetical protein